MNLDINGFKKIINNKFLSYAPRITLGGGEPYLNKNIFDFIKILKEKKKVISIYTNGSLIERNYINFFKYQPNYLNISHYDDKFDSLKSVFKKINNHNDKNFISRLSKIIQSNKLDDMEKMILISIENNFDRIIFQNYFPYKEKEKELVLYNDNIQFQNLKKFLSKKYKNKLKIVWPNLLDKREVFRCNNISINTTVDANGNIAPCCFLTPPEKKMEIYF
jgi:MoaA/NifB/PqqE/SkfB family radical SAM enzyme